MKLYLDTAKPEEIREIAAWGVLSGLTTNPSLLAKAGISVGDFMAEVVTLISGPVSLEVTAEDADEMIKQASHLRRYGENVVIKVPLTAQGLCACHTLANRGMAVNLTLVFSANQALLAAEAGAAYVSPFVGRLHDNGADGIRLVEEIRRVLDRCAHRPEIIAASIRSPRDVTEAALAGADIATIPYDIMKKMLYHPLTKEGLDRFKTDWQNSGLSL